jgi:two-component system, OmpR family, response regulator
MRVLIAEDEPLVANSIAQTVKAMGFLPHVVHDGDEAWFNGSTEKYAAIVLDIGLPSLDGLTILKRWRKEGITTPVVVLSARGTWAERVDGIDSGADDYIAKPFEMAELVARLKAIMRRSGGVAKNAVDVGPLHIDLQNGTTSVNNVPVMLTPLEFRLLQYLAMNLGRVVPQSELAESLYSFNHERDANAIEAAISRLRKKLGGNLVKNKRGFGYFISLEKSEDPPAPHQQGAI